MQLFALRSALLVAAATVLGVVRADFFTLKHLVQLQEEYIFCDTSKLYSLLELTLS